MSDLPISSPELPRTTSIPFPSEMRLDKPLDPDSLALLQSQWDLFNALKDQPRVAANPIRERISRGEPALAKGALVHGSRYSPELIDGVRNLGVVSGELIGIPEDMETNYSADFFKVPEDLSVADYLAFCQVGVQRGMVRTHRPEFHFLPMPSPVRSGKKIAFIVDATDSRIAGLLAQDAYDPENIAIQKIVSRLPVSNDSSAANRISAILVGIPANFISGMILGEGVTEAEREDIRSKMRDVVLFNTSGEVI